MNPIEYYRPFGQPATATITIAKVPTVGDSVTLAGTLYVYGTSFVGDTVQRVAASLCAAINANRGEYGHEHNQTQPIRSVYAMYYSNVVRLIATVPGSEGNTITVATSAAGTFTLSGAALSGGAVGGALAPQVCGFRSYRVSVGAGAMAQFMPTAGPTEVIYVMRALLCAPASNTANVEISFLSLSSVTTYAAYTLVPGTAGYVLEAPAGFKIPLSTVWLKELGGLAAQNVDGWFMYTT